VPGSENIVESAALCRASCAAERRCSAWVWCWREGGCDDGHEWDPRGRPFRSCALYELPAGRPLAEHGRGPQFSSFSQGFMPGAWLCPSGAGAATADEVPCGLVRVSLPCLHVQRRLWLTVCCRAPYCGHGADPHQCVRICARAEMGDLAAQNSTNSSEPADGEAEEPAAENSPRNSSVSAVTEAEAANAADDTSEAADNSTLPARRSLLGSAAAPLREERSSAAADRQPTLFRRALHAAGGWSDLLGRFKKADEANETSVALARRPRPPGQPNVAITTAIPPNPCG